MALAAVGAACAPPPGPPPPPGDPLGAGACAWPNVTNQASLNVAFPDANATYWSQPVVATADTEVTITGSFPFARYMSFNTYDFGGSSVDGIADQLIQPDAGSGNPFTTAGVPPDPGQRRYTVTAAGRVADGDANTIRLLPDGVERGVGWLVLRVYVPEDPTDPTGGVPLPSLTVTVNGVPLPTRPPCTTQGSPPPAIIAAALLTGPAPCGRPGQPACPPDLEFRKPVSTGGFFPNVDNQYVAALANHRPGRIVVIRGRAPTTSPDRQYVPPAAGQPPYQLRYWSFCNNVYLRPWPVVADGCAVDETVPLDADGFYTVIVATPRDVPSNAAGATVLPWSDRTRPTNVVILRNMLPDPTFANAIQRIGPGQDAATVMGEYYPVARYCPTRAFERGGAAACGF